MRDTLPLLATPFVFAISVLGPGLFVARWIPWRGAERATAVLVASILPVSLVSLGIGLFGLHPLLRPAMLAACALAGVLGWRRAWDAEAGRVVRPYLVLVVWLTSLASLIVIYSGGHWHFDWLEHYQRSRFFLGGQSPWKLFAGQPLAARPPLFNAFAAQVLATTGGRFPVYQWTALLFSALAYVPALALARLWSGSRHLPWTLLVLLGFLPLFAENCLYPWTKMPAVFFTLAAVAFYAAGWESGDSRRVLFAFACGAAGVLTHLSSLPVVLFLAAHHLLAGSRRSRRPAADRLAVIAIVAAILAPWYVWLLGVFGMRETMAAALTWRTAAEPGAWRKAAAVILNLRDTIVPYFLRGTSLAIPDGATWGRVREAAFTLYMRNLVFAFGIAGAALLAFEGWRSLGRSTPRPDSGRRARRRFWFGLALAGIVGGQATYMARDVLGTAHLMLQAIVVLGLALLAARFETWPRPVRVLAAAGAIVDALLGVLLNVWIQSYPPDLPASWHGPLGLSFADLLPARVLGDWTMKSAEAPVFMADLLAPWRGIAWCVAGSLFLIGSTFLVRSALVSAAHGRGTSVANSAQ